MAETQAIKAMPIQPPRPERRAADRPRSAVRMSRVLAIALSVILLAAGCGDDGERGSERACDPSLNGVPDGPDPGGQSVFRLAEESTVELSDGSREPLSGSLLVSECLSPNTFFAGRIETLQIDSRSVAVESGCVAIGTLVSSTLYGGETPTGLSVSVRLNGELGHLGGNGSPIEYGRLEVILASGGYTFRVIAIIEQQLNAGAGVPHCGEWGFV
jgi:hypothetical protein